MIEKPLSIREKKVLCASLCYPYMKEKDIARMLNLNQSTYNVIKRRLKRRDLYKKIRVPCLFKMGFELFGVVHADISPLSEIDEKKAESLLKEMQMGSFSFLSRRHLITMGFVQNYSTAVSEHIRLKEFLREESGREEVKTRLSLFPSEQSAILNFFNLGPSLADLWELTKYKKRPGAVCGMEESGSLPKIGGMSWKVFGALLAFPDLSDSKIADHLKTSRQVVNKYKKTFEDGGFIHTVGITNPLKLGMEVMSARWIRFIDRSGGSHLERLEEVCLKTSQYFMAAGPEEIFTLSLYPDLTTLEVDESTFLRALQEQGIVPFETSYSLISLPDSLQPTFFNFEKAAEILDRGTIKK
ncbi:MAG TPA: hypothetical protein ENF69_03465 [Euryarchaeota archaeon]|nr:hypothetical protein [Euryarchaeota archaeon]